jgi:hypothetical protein
MEGMKAISAAKHKKKRMRNENENQNEEKGDKEYKEYKEEKVNHVAQMPMYTLTMIRILMTTLLLRSCTIRTTELNHCMMEREIRSERSEKWHMEKKCRKMFCAHLQSPFSSRDHLWPCNATLAKPAQDSFSNSTKPTTLKEHKTEQTHA